MKTEIDELVARIVEAAFQVRVQARQQEKSDGEVGEHQMLPPQRSKFCTVNQERLLKRYGHKTEKMTLKTASRLIDGLVKSGTKKRRMRKV